MLRGMGGEYGDGVSKTNHYPSSLLDGARVIIEGRMKGILVSVVRGTCTTENRSVLGRPKTQISRCL